MAKKSKLDMILERMEEGFKAVNARLDKLEADVALIKQCPTIKKELELISNN